ncbi:MAG: aminopeptidase P N-terminal domain-containing protein [Acidobacteriia bacterium]|nr:aminopeptidase P N-terminal domain-containing protein [Terriglobia bacterium]
MLLNSKARLACAGMAGSFLLLTVMSTLNWGLEKEPMEVYRARRAAVMDKLKDGVIVIFGLKESEQSDADLTRFRQDDYFYYLSGWDEPGAILMLLPKGRQNIATAMFPGEQTNREILFLANRDPVRERWTGPKLGPVDKQTATLTGFPLVLPLDRFPIEMSNALSAGQTIYTILPLATANLRLSREQEKAEQLKALAPFAEIHDARSSIDNLRQVKGKSEVAFLQKAVDASVDAHLAAMKAIKPGVFEYQVAALLKYTWENAGCERAAYAPIVGSGFDSTVLHYNQDDQPMLSGQTVVVDAAGEFSGYAADITRTYPVSGKFTERQKQIYELVLGAQEEAVNAIVPGKTLLRGLTQVVKDYFKKSPLRGPKGEDDTLDHYFIHGTGHWLGLAVHDVGDYNRPIDKNMIFTIEPGLYIPEENLGVRIEDDYMVNGEGKIVKLSSRLPSSIQEVERSMSGATPKGR